jgi:hypothetical protein
MSTTVASFAQIKLEPYINPQFARTKAARFAPSQTIARGTLVGQITASGLYLPYASGAVDGSQVPVGITVYDIVVDPSGSTSGILTSSDGTSEIYWRGAFLETELTGLDANAITVLKAREMGVGTVKHVYIP